MAKTLTNYYDVLCVPSSATNEELRRAYRILARRYHPDVNPGKASEEKFKAIAEAYSVLSEPSSRAQFDAEFLNQTKSGGNPKVRAYASAQDKSNARRRYYEAQQRVREKMAEQEQPKTTRPQKPGSLTEQISSAFDLLKGALGNSKTKKASPRPPSVAKLSIVEISVSMKDALQGVRKAVEVAEPDGTRKLSVTIPPGVRSGSVIRMRDKKGSGEEVVCIIRVASHPYISIENKGVVVETPVSISEAAFGASITLPTFEDPIVVKIPPASQSGTELRVKGKGILTKEGERGDLFFKLMIRLPDPVTAVGLSDKIKDLEGYYSGNIRNYLPATLFDV